jgi:hypothetical protein
LQYTELLKENVHEVKEEIKGAVKQLHKQNKGKKPRIERRVGRKGEG